MKNNIIQDDREISLKGETLPADLHDNPDSVEPLLSLVATNNHLPTEPEMNITIADLPASTNEPMMTSDEPMMTSDEPMMTSAEPTIDPAVALQSTQSEITALFENAKSTTTNFFNNNRQIFTTLGWIVLAILGVKFVFAALGIIDDIPLVAPIIKLVGLVSVVRFAWRYLIREHDRQELIEIIDRTKVEVLGDREPLS
jgi:CAAD domains of cyanobacterial aminoacyl-tRNA synthetase